MHMDKNCIFCKIVNRLVEANFIVETDNFVVFKDIHPSAPIHYLIVPKSHFKNFLELPDILWIEAKEIANSLKKREKLEGFRLSTNYGDAAMIEHCHIHFLAGIQKDRTV